MSTPANDEDRMHVAAGARELWFEEKHRVALRDGTIPRAQADDEIVVRALASTISRGTELLLYRGDVGPGFDGAAPDRPLFPRRYGYSWVGEVVQGNAAFATGTRVFSLLSHGTHHVVKDTAVRRLDPTIPAARATLAANLETAISATWDSGAGFGSRVLVLGAGIVGLLTAWVLTKAGAFVTVVDPSSDRLRNARTFGLSEGYCTVPERPPGFDAAGFDAAGFDAAGFDAAGFDSIVEASGAPAALLTAVQSARLDTQITLVSLYGMLHSTSALGELFHRKRLTLRASQVSTLPASHAAHWTFARRFALVEHLLLDPALDCLVGNCVPFADAQAAYAALDADTSQLTATFLYT